jgi:hypothetical protein
MPHQVDRYADMADAFCHLPAVASIRIFSDLGLQYILRLQDQLNADEAACRRALVATSAAQTPRPDVATTEDMEAYHSQQQLIADMEKRLDKYCMGYCILMQLEASSKRARELSSRQLANPFPIKVTLVTQFLQVSSLAPLEELDVENLRKLREGIGHREMAGGAPWERRHDLRSLFKNVAGRRNHLTRFVVELFRLLKKRSKFNELLKVSGSYFLTQDLTSGAADVFKPLMIRNGLGCLTSVV